MFLDVLKVGLEAETALYGPLCAATQHRIELSVVELDAAVAPDARGHTSGEGGGELALHRIHRVESQAGAKCPNAA